MVRSAALWCNSSDACILHSTLHCTAALEIFRSCSFDGLSNNIRILLDEKLDKTSRYEGIGWHSILRVIVPRLCCACFNTILIVLRINVFGRMLPVKIINKKTSTQLRNTSTILSDAAGFLFLWCRSSPSNIYSQSTYVRQLFIIRVSYTGRRREERLL